MLAQGEKARMDGVVARAEYVWDNPELARRWMNKPHPELGFQIPLELSYTEEGAKKVMYILDALFYGLPV